MRLMLRTLGPAAGGDRLLELMRQEAPSGRAGKPVLSLIASHPELVRRACLILKEEPGAGVYALRLLARLHNRLEEWDALRAVLRALIDALPEDRELRREFLRCELVAPAPDEAARDEAWALGAPGLSPLAAIAAAVQRRISLGQPPAPEDLLAALDRRLAKLDPAAFPPALARIAAARDVALVGSGSATRGRGLGAEIDAHDCVVRINYPLLSGFEADVGARTDAMVFAEVKRPELPTLLAREPGHPAIPAMSLQTRPSAEARLRDPPGLPRDLGLLVGDVAYRQPSTGFHAIVLIGLLLRRPLTLYGFDFFRPGAPGHYYGPATAALQHELAYERWYTEAVLPALCPELRRQPEA